MNNAVVGLLAHVDAGKTTLAEALLYHAGTIRKLGRVDHKDAFLDFEGIERERGITVFSKQAYFDTGHTHVMLIDTPGHVDFCAEAERTMSVMDLAVLVIAANEGVSARTRTLWKLLERYAVPTMVFVNKLDLYDGTDEQFLDELGRELGDLFADAKDLLDEAVQEALATSDEASLEEFLENGSLGDETIRRLFRHRQLVPCHFGSALRREGAEELIRSIDFFAPRGSLPDPFGARVYKVSHGMRKERLAWMKVTGGALHAKEVLQGILPTGERWVGKADQIRVYNGSKYNVVNEVEAGRVCAVVGLDQVMPGNGLGFEKETERPMLLPVLNYAVHPRDCDAHAVHQALRLLCDEDPLLGLTWDERLKESCVQLMGEVQQEIILERLREEFGLEVDFGVGSILYKETINEPVEGVGHFEPLRHYAEVHLKLEPLQSGCGMEFGTTCSEDDLDRNWQRLILTSAMERDHCGVLTGSPITDIRITLLAGRAHPKHTEGGDFRQATYRAIRQGLMQTKSELLEPWYGFVLTVPSSRVGRAMSDLQRMHAEFGVPESQGDHATITGAVPVSEVGEYPLQVSAYTAGQGSMLLQVNSYRPCHNASEVIERMAYEPESDLSNTADSVFCSHGAGYTVKWHDVAAHAHVDSKDVRSRPFVPADSAFFAGG